MSSVPSCPAAAGFTYAYSFNQTSEIYNNTISLGNNAIGTNEPGMSVCCDR